LVIGGGWAGLTAARELTKAGWQVAVFEEKPWLGGRAMSLRHPQTGMITDNGVHVLLGCCRRVRNWLEVLGAEDAVVFQPTLTVPVWADGRWVTFRGARWSGVLHLLPALLGYRHLSVGERWQALRLGRRMLSVSAERVDGMSFEMWLKQYGQNARSIERLWQIITVAILNAPIDEVSAGQALAAFQRGILPGYGFARLGFFTRPLQQLAERARCWLVQHRVAFHLGHRVNQVIEAGGKVRGLVLDDGRTIDGDVVVVAVPPRRLARLLPEQWRRHAFFAPAWTLDDSPIVNICLRYDRPVMNVVAVARATGLAQFVVNRSRLWGEAGHERQDIVVSVSAAARLRTWPAHRLLAQATQELAEMWPSAAGARILASQVIWQRHATFWARPGSGASRLGSVTPLKGLVLAGDWTQTGWPASLESAVVSGEAAAWSALHEWESTG
jgi:squalene-associated FAD-dependent desaturase